MEEKRQTRLVTVRALSLLPSGSIGQEVSSILEGGGEAGGGGGVGDVLNCCLPYSHLKIGHASLPRRSILFLGGGCGHCDIPP